MKKIYFLILVFSLLIIKPEYINGVSMDVEYLDILIGKFGTDELLELKSDNGFEISNKEAKSDSISIKSNHIFISYKDNKTLEILDENENIIEKLPMDASSIIKGEFSRQDITQVNKDKYRDYINFIFKDNTVLIVNHIKVNNYLYGVLPKEVGPSFPYEALKAQAVASKNYAFTNINKHKNDGYHLCHTTHCQVYGGYDGEHEIINKAIDETIDIFITYNGKLISTPYHSNSGGHTENSEDVWGGNLPYLRAVKDDFSIGTPYSTWDIEFSPLEIKEKLSSGGINIGDILDFEILEKSSGGGILKCKIKGSKGQEILTGDKLRSILGNTLFKSTTFQVQKSGLGAGNYVFAVSGNSNKSYKIDLNNAYILQGGKPYQSNRSSKKRVVSRNETRSIQGVSTGSLTFKFNGTGYGHGVGMSQWGANEMAKQGYDYEDILSHYYKDIEFVDINKTN